MLAIERFLFGEVDAKNEEEQDSDRLGSEGNSSHTQIAKCRSDLTTYTLRLREFRQQVGRLIKIDENTLPSTILEKLIEVSSQHLVHWLCVKIGNYIFIFFSFLGNCQVSCPR